VQLRSLVDCLTLLQVPVSLPHEQIATSSSTIQSTWFIKAASTTSVTKRHAGQVAKKWNFAKRQGQTIDAKVGCVGPHRSSGSTRNWTAFHSYNIGNKIYLYRIP
jgi:hypothetical protein